MLPRRHTPALIHAAIDAEIAATDAQLMSLFAPQRHDAAATVLPRAGFHAELRCR